MNSLNSIAVLGGGAWGTALAQTAARAGRSVTLWEHDPRNAQHLIEARESLFLPGVTLEPAITVTRDLEQAARADAVLLVIPAQVLRQVVTSLAPLIGPRTPLVACAKGIEHGSRKFMTEIVAECAPNAIPAILSGPSFAADVARGQPTAVTIAATDAAVAQGLAQAMNSGSFRPYHSTDVRGVELGGATKNVMAIAAGIVEGKQLGASALAAMTTRGFTELVRFGKAYGARIETMTGLSGLGDLVLTCGTPQSRNFSFGMALGRGESAATASQGKLAEGFYTAPVLLEMAQAKGVEMPISAAVAAILDGKIGIDAAIGGLLTRPLKAEE